VNETFSGGHLPRAFSIFRKSTALWLASSLILSGCTESSSAPSSDPEVPIVISDFSLDVDPNFIGTWEAYEAAGTPLTLKLDGIANVDELSQKCIRAYLDFKIPAIPKYDSDEISDRVAVSLRALETDEGPKFAIDLERPWFFPTLAALPDGTNVDFKLEFFQWKVDVERYSGCAKEFSLERESDAQLLSSASLTWTRPPREGPPAPPVLVVKDSYLYSTEPCSQVFDAGAHRFSEFPISEKGTLQINGSTENIHDPALGWTRLYNGFFDGTCNEASVEVLATISLVNDLGESETALLQFTTPEPGVTREELDEQRKQKLIAGCESNLRISEFDISSCGLLKVEVFQYDLNTGACTFLGYWKDSAGAKKVGMFDLCANNFGSVVEGNSYSFYVRNSGPVQYTNTLGTVQNVLYFTILAQ
jgi:hypothetical protein